MATDRALIGAPLRLRCGMTLPNRTVKAALEEDLADPANNRPPFPLFGNLYGRWARGGYGMILTGHVLVSRRHLGLPGDPSAERKDFDDPVSVAAWKEYARVCKSGGSVAVAQINHPGRQTYAFCHAEGDLPIAPSDQTEDGFGRKVDPAHKANPNARGFMHPARAATLDEIEWLIRSFADTAEFVKMAGFDGIQIHAAVSTLFSTCVLEVKSDV